MRFATDTGGTFTDLIVETNQGALRMYKAPTVPSDPVQGVLAALQLAAEDAGDSLEAFLAQGETLVHGTTRAINAIITGNTARTAFLTTEGHADILVLREGGREEPFNHTIPYPEPYVPRRFTFEIRERINSAGEVFTPLNEANVMQVIERLAALDIEAVGVCFLWSIINPAHEKAVGKLLDRNLPGVNVTLSHTLNPCIREYPRAISTCIDASLKPVMAHYLETLESCLVEAGFNGRVLVLTSMAGMLDAASLAESPVHAINSGPSAAPVAGRYYAGIELDRGDVIVADTGGTTYDISLVRDGYIPFTRENWLGKPFCSDMTGLASVDVKSIGAGGGSIAWLDEGGVLHVGPESAGADPGPASYGRGGELPTLTDACLVLGYIDPGYFLGGAMKLDSASARKAITSLAEALAMELEQAACAIVDVATEQMVQAIADITINRGIDPTRACLVGGGGAAGLNSVLVARRLGCPQLLIPSTGAGLSAAGALMTEIGADYRRMQFAVSDEFAAESVNKVLAELEQDCLQFADTYGEDAVNRTIEFAVEARYPGQVWEIELGIEDWNEACKGSIGKLVEDFHSLHNRIYAVADRDSPVEFITWIARVRCALVEHKNILVSSGEHLSEDWPGRQAYFHDTGKTMVDVYRLDALSPAKSGYGPAIIESPFTSVVIPPGAEFLHTKHGSLLINPAGQN